MDRETIMNLPESVLLCLFPNGLVLSRQSVALSEGGEGEEEEEVYAIDVSGLRFLSPFPSLSLSPLFGLLTLGGLLLFWLVRSRLLPVCFDIFPECIRSVLWDCK